MSYAYQKLARRIAAITKQIVDGEYADLEAAYVDVTIESHLDGTELTYSMLRHAIIAAGKQVAALVATSPNAMWRASLAAQSLTIADGANVPRTDENGYEFIGSLDGFWDTATTPDKSLREGTAQEVERYLESVATGGHGFWKINPYKYFIDGKTLRHTGSTVVARGCSWDDVIQEGVFDATGLCPLPQELEIFHMCKTIAMLPQEGWEFPEAQYYARAAEAEEANIVEGRVRLMTAPQLPAKTASVEPNKD